MFLHNKRMMYRVQVDEPNPHFAKMLLDQFGGPNGELAAAMRYFTQGWNEPDEKRRSMLLDIATEELSHLEMVAQSLVMLTKGSPADLVDQVEGNYLGDLLNGKRPDYVNLFLTAGPILQGVPRLIDSEGNPFTSAYIDTIAQPEADLRSDIAAEGRAKITYERLIKCTDDAGMKDTLNFLMTREIAHQKMFEAALASLEDNFPPGKLPGDAQIAHVYVGVEGDYAENGGSADRAGFDLAQHHSDWGFKFDDQPVTHAAHQEVL
jgi:Mn-containing catalase